MANTKIKFDFNQTKVTVATAEFLLGIYNPVEEDEDSTELRDHLQVAIEGKYLKVKDANFLLQKILTAMIINDNVDEDAIKNALKDAKEAGPSGITKENPIGTNPNDEHLKDASTKVKFNTENVCHFFATNKCKFGKDCIKSHPKLCNKFKRFGLVKFNKNGCTEDCEFYHPKACFESMKTKTCKRHDCKFFHITGTKKEETNAGIPGNNNSNAGNHNNSSNYSNNGTNGGQNGNNCSNSNPNSNNNSQMNGTQQTSQQLGFQESRQPWEIVIPWWDPQSEDQY